MIFLKENLFEGKYIDEEKWEGKGYDNYNNIIYELKHGKGSVENYYNDGRLKFKGEYLNGFKNRKGKEYDGFDNLIFEGEYLNGKRNGKGKEYCYLYKEFFEDEYINGKKREKEKYLVNLVN